MTRAQASSIPPCIAAIAPADASAAESAAADATTVTMHKLTAAMEPLLATDAVLREWCTEDTVRRFLRADRGDLSKASKRLRDTLEWRRAARPERARCPACFNAALNSHYMQHVGFDTLGRALVFSDIGLARDKKASSNAEHCVQVLELLEPSLPPYPHDQYVWVCDFHKFGIADCDPRMAVKCLGLFGKCYPERMGAMILVGAPSIFNGLYRVVSQVVDPSTLKKVKFLRGPDGKGGGAPLEPFLRETFDAQTATWLLDEMLENRRRWKEAKDGKSWLASVLSGNGQWRTWPGHGDGKKKKPSTKDADADAETDDGGGWHDCRGTPEWVCGEAGARAAAFARSGACDGAQAKLVPLPTAGAGAITRAPATKREELPPHAHSDDDDDDEHDAFHDALESLAIT